MIFNVRNLLNLILQTILEVKVHKEAAQGKYMHDFVWVSGRVREGGKYSKQ